MIDVINLKKDFGGNQVLNGINVKINKGDIVCVIGPSGSGKSTFLRWKIQAAARLFLMV